MSFREKHSTITLPISQNQQDVEIILLASLPISRDVFHPISAQSIVTRFPPIKLILHLIALWFHYFSLYYCLEWEIRRHNRRKIRL